MDLAMMALDPRWAGSQTAFKKGTTGFYQRSFQSNCIRRPKSCGVAGKYKRVMPSFEKIKKQEIISILAYIHNETQLHHIEPLAVDAKKPGTAG
jgi:hypothetical protein